MNWTRALAAALLWLSLVQAGMAATDGLTFERRRWSQAEGAPQTADSIAQTDDGLLWFGTSAGMVTFDGIRFERTASVYGGQLRSDNIACTQAIRGGLAVGYIFGGMSVFSKTGTTHYLPGKELPGGSITALASDSRGALYAGTSTGVMRLYQGRWEAMGAGSTPAESPVYVSVDRDDTVWAVFNYSFQSGYSYYAMPRGSRRFERVFAAPMTGTRKVGGREVVMLPGERYVELAAGAPPRPLALHEPRRYDDVLLGGPAGTLWTSREDGFVRLVRRADGVLEPAEKFDRPGGMARYTTASLLDREGNLWVVTLEGVERYRLHRLQHLGESGSGTNWLAVPGLGDELWYGPASGALMRMDADGRRRPTGLRNANVVLRAAADRVWVGTTDALWEFHGATRRRHALPEADQWGLDVQALAVDRQGRLLASLIRKGLWRFEAGRWTQDDRTRGIADPTPISMLTTADGRTWLGFTNGRLGELTATGVHLLPELPVGNVLSMLEYRGRLLVGGERGVSWLDGGRAQPLLLRHGGALLGVAGMAADSRGDLWLHGVDGLHRIAAAGLAAAFADPATTVDGELFNFEDGLRGQVSQLRPLPALSVVQGRIYFATRTQAGWLDPSAIPRNPRAPDVLIRSIRAGGRDYPAADGLALPERTTALDVAFTATALSIPERVRLRYRLEGVDAGWRDVQHERSASYTNLAPGSYRFHVIAANEDGVWNTTGAALRFEIAPAVWQTTWFRALCMLAALALLALLYRWRLAVAGRRATERATARMEERERIARSLHDTLLQAVQGMVLRFQAEVWRMPPESPTAAALDAALNDADRLIASTRDEVMALRRVPQGAELLDELRAAVSTLAPGSDHLLHFSLEGEPRLLRGEAAGEIFCALREAAVNSVRHARASRIVVELRFLPRMLEASVCDDGVGIDRKVAHAGRAGHFGIVGMRERVRHLGGRIAVGAAQGGGTVVRIRIPARAAYQAPPRPRWRRWLHW